MFKLVVLLSVAAMAAAKPGVVAPVVYSSVVPASSSISEYSTSVLHGSPALYRAPAIVSAPVVVSAPAVVPAVAALPPSPYLALRGVHHLGKRSIGVLPLTYNPLISNVGPVALTAPLGYSSVYPRALSWHPY
ncbi:unnamed protein product [Arctia plantaginis]|uniref:Uncharacterized protein n=1 Tax=Arctia plantaginis TaxID=874455 RepID=A0A8S1B168_ARCPL|nr:unnamed protein product [Arctia plantaginis]CAB3259821.1 unnamed protein product [Arctia plantaginis]